MIVPFKRESYRKKKIEGLIRQEVSKIVLHEISDPRCGFCTVTKVNLSRDLKSADVYVSVLGEEADQRTTMRGLMHATRYIERRLFQELSLKHPPSITFHIDHSIERSIRISQILREEGVPESGSMEQAEQTDENAESPETQGKSSETDEAE